MKLAPCCPPITLVAGAALSGNPEVCSAGCGYVCSEQQMMHAHKLMDVWLSSVHVMKQQACLQSTWTPLLYFTLRYLQSS